MAISISGLSHVYPKAEKAVLSQLTVEFSAAKIHGIIGDNGVGKTTLLRLISGLEKIQKGTVLLGGEPAGLNMARTKGVVYVASKPLVFSGSVLENAIIPLMSRGLDRDAAVIQVEEHMVDLDLWRLRHQKACSLSSGETQKLAILRAVVLHPSVLLVDEPTGNVDTSMTLAVEAILRRLVRATGATVLLVSHDQAQIDRLSCCIWRLEGDRIVRIGEEKTC